MSKKEDMALQLLVAYAKCDCETAMRILDDPAYDMYAEVIYHEVPDEDVRELVNSESGVTKMHTAFAEACPHVLERMRELKAVQDGMAEYSTALDLLARE